MIVTGVGADQASSSHSSAGPFTATELNSFECCKIGNIYRHRQASLIATYRDIVPDKWICDQRRHSTQGLEDRRKQVIQNLTSLLKEGCRSRNPIAAGTSGFWSSNRNRKMSLPADENATSRLTPIDNSQQETVSRLESSWSPIGDRILTEEGKQQSTSPTKPIVIVNTPVDDSQKADTSYGPNPGECISAQSFERRRSLYEQQLQQQLQQEIQSRRASRLERGQDADLSLDQILADIQDGKLTHLTTGDVDLIANNDGTSIKLQPRDDDSQDGHNKDEDEDVDEESATPGDGMTEIDLSGAAERYEHQLQREHESVTGFEIAWLEFTYSVGPNLLEDPRWGSINKMFHKEHRVILKGLSGGLKSGQMVALMGPSGAGKTCLLECISGVRMSGIGGRLCLRGRKQVKLVIVPQYDDFMPQFTVEEIIMFGSKMKNHRSANHVEIVDKIIDQLGLKGCRKNNIKNCSGGQQKRVAIAQELVSRPNILVLDEPTSGLDSSCCYQTMKVLRDVLDQSAKGEQPMAIVSTIHQPSAKVFKMFDLVYLLSKRGLMAYSGPPSQLLDTIKHVTGLECPRYSNPADYMIEMVSYDYGTEPVDLLIEFEKEKARKFVCQFDQRSQTDATGGSNNYNNEYSGFSDDIGPQEAGSRKASAARANCVVLNPRRASIQLKSSKSDTHLIVKLSGQQDHQRPANVSHLLETANARQHIQYQTRVTVELRKATQNSDQINHPFFWHTWLHLHRSFYQSIRDPILNNMRILIHLGFAILLVLLYGRKSGEARGCPPVLGLPREITDPNNEIMIDLADNIGYLFMCIMMITYVSLMSMVLTFPIDIKTVGKEYKNGWYGTVTYFLGKTIADLPFIVTYPLVYSLITWYVTNQAQDKAWRFLCFTMLIIMNAMNSQSFGLILGALFVNSVTAATFLGPVITIPWYLFTGFTKRIHRLAEPFKTASRFLFTRHIFEGILDTVYGHQRCNCSAFLEEYNQLRFDEAMRLGQLISVETLSSLDYYDDLTNLDAYNAVAGGVETANGTEVIGGNWLTKTVNVAKNVFAASDELDLASLMESNVRSSSLFSFGLDFEPSCPIDYDNYIVQDFRLDDKTNEHAFLFTAIALTIIRVLTFIVVAWKIRTRQL